MKKKVVTKAEYVKQAYYSSPEYYAVMLVADYFSPYIRNVNNPFLTVYSVSKGTYPPNTIILPSL